MRFIRLFLVVVSLAALAGLAYVAQVSESSGRKMAQAAERLLASLTAGQRAKALMTFDDQERLNWHFIPLQDAQRRSTRKGIPLEDMSPEQQKAARELLRAGTSDRGYGQATTIMSLESILHDLEKGGAMVRDPQWYFFTIFGEPSRTGRWGWRIEGHHLALNFVIDQGKVVASTPAFFGANPATVKAGPKKGKRTLGDADDLARELFNSLDDGQRKTALQEKQFGEVEGKTTAPRVGEPVGIAASALTAKQHELLVKLLKAYTSRMPDDVAETEYRQVEEAGLDRVHFAYAGGTGDGQPRTYRIQGPTFVVEFLNTQADSARNPANHIHSCWRSIKNDFGLMAGR